MNMCLKITQILFDRIYYNNNFVDIGVDYQLLSSNLIVHPWEFTKDMALIRLCHAWLSIEWFTFSKMLAVDVLIEG